MDPPMLNEIWNDQFPPQQRLLVKHRSSTIGGGSSHDNSCYVSILAPELVDFRCPIRPYETHMFPFYSQGLFVTCCEGLICFDNFNDRIVIFNPTTKQLKFLPPAPRDTNSEFLSLRLYHATGFGFDTSANDYKVVRIFDYSYEYKLPGDYISSYMGCRTVVEVYSLKDECWREIECPSFVGATINCDIFEYVAGTYYWLIGLGPCELISFDFASETFSTSSFPTHGDLYNRNLYELLELESKLVAVGYNRPGTLPDDLFVFWMRDGDSWQLMTKIVLDSCVRPILLKSQLLFFAKKTEKDGVSEVVVVVIPGLIGFFHDPYPNSTSLGFFDSTRNVKLVCYSESMYHLSNAQPMNGSYTIVEYSSDDQDPDVVSDDDDVDDEDHPCGF